MKGVASNDRNHVQEIEYGKKDRCGTGTKAWGPFSGLGAPFSGN